MLQDALGHEWRIDSDWSELQFLQYLRHIGDIRDLLVVDGFHQDGCQTFRRPGVTYFESLMILNLNQVRHVVTEDTIALIHLVIGDTLNITMISLDVVINARNIPGRFPKHLYRCIASMGNELFYNLGDHLKGLLTCHMMRIWRASCETPL